MKIIVKSIGIAIFNLIVLFFLKLLFDHMGGLISGSFFGGLDIKDWWYELKRDNMLYYLIGTAGLSGGLCSPSIWTATMMKMRMTRTTIRNKRPVYTDKI